MKFLRLIIICFLLLSYSCVKQAPQLPANKVKQRDTVGDNVLIINKLLADKEDSSLYVFVRKQKTTFKKSPVGFWYKIITQNKGKMLKEKDTCTVLYAIHLLKGNEVEQSKKTVVIGKREVIVGLEEALKLMRVQDSAILVIPWYLAHGMRGNEKNIPSYSSIIYNIKVVK